MLQDKQTIMQVLGCILKDPSIVAESSKYKLVPEDFPEKFHRIIFSVMRNLQRQGVEDLNLIEIVGYLQEYPTQYKFFEDANGDEYIEKVQEFPSLENFDYYYEKLKKFSLLREMQGIGFDISGIYDDTLVDPKEQEEMQSNFDSTSVEEILRIYENNIVEIKEKFKESSDSSSIQGGEGVNKLLERIKKSPEIGAPMNSEILTSLFRGSRLKKFYLRSGTTGVGKTRNMVADACVLSATMLYDSEKRQWIENKWGKHSNVTSTEMLQEELQTIALAFISDVNEEKIQLNNMSEDEEARVIKAAEILSDSPIWFDYLPDFNIQEIERTIERNVVKNRVQYYFYDYIHTSVSIFAEMAKGSGIKLREDQVLLVISDKLKTLANKYKIFLSSATQLNGEWKEAWKKGEVIDGQYLSGSKAVANKTDAGMIILPLSNKEKKAVEKIMTASGRFGGREPNFVVHVYKNRGNRHVNVKVFTHINMGTMRIKDCFVTNVDNEIVNVDKLVIQAG